MLEARNFEATILHRGYHIADDYVTGFARVEKIDIPVNNTASIKKEEKSQQMAMQEPKLERFSIQLHGPFCISRGDGTRVAIQSRKGMALLALLAANSNMEHERVWLMTMLWGSRGHEQAQSSLRQELSRLKKLLNGTNQVIRADRLRVSLSLDHVTVLDPLPGAEFLEGIDIPGEDGFEDWLLLKRQSAAPTPRAHRPAVETRKHPELSISIKIESFASGQKQALNQPYYLQGAVSQYLTEFGGILVHDAEFGAADARLNFKVMPELDYIVIIASLEIASSGRSLLSLQRRLSNCSRLGSEPLAEAGKLANELADQVIMCLARNEVLFRDPDHLATMHLLRGIETHFSRKQNAAQAADNFMLKAIDQFESSSFWAWRAYNIALFLEDEKNQDIRQLREKAVCYARRALEIDPYNGLTLALLTHVHAFVLRDFDRAGDCLSQAIRQRADHVMTFDTSALLRLYTGDILGARADAFNAEHYGRHLSYRYCFATTQAMIETLSGNFVAATRHGERALSMMPVGHGQLYKPTLRYLGISYAQSGAEQRALNTFERLASLEGELRAGDVRDGSYPMPSRTATDMLVESLRRLGK